MGLLCCMAGEKVVRFLPPLNVRDDELEEALDILDDALDMLYGEEAEEAEAEETPEAEA
jgi:acetylornithine/succinyldiaminopimelate/putrescine aminotransferase